jgi:hypothetical protein
VGNVQRFVPVHYGLVEAESAARIVVPAALGELTLRAGLPPSIVLGRPFALAASVAAESTALDRGREYVGGLERLSGVHHALFLDASLEVEGRPLTVAIEPSIAASPTGREIMFMGRPASTERREDAGKPRTAELYTVRAVSMAKQSDLEARFEPVPPGTLSNKPRRLVLHARARLRIAVSPSTWPPGRPLPDTQETIGGVSFFMDPVDVPPVEIDLEAVYVRVSPVAPPPRVPVARALRDIRIGVGDPVDLPALDVEAELKMAAASRGGRPVTAQAHARRAVFASPLSSETWRLLGETHLDRGGSDEATSALEYSAHLDPESGRTLAALADAYDRVSRMKDARATAKLASTKNLDPESRERVRRILGD